jgi:hypothetical protein
MKVCLPLRENQLDSPQDNFENDRSDGELIEPVETGDRRSICNVETFEPIREPSVKLRDFE